MLENTNGVTIKELIEWLQQLPNNNGTVWVGDSEGYSNECVEVWMLNQRETSCDVLLSIRVVEQE